MKQASLFRDLSRDYKDDEEEGQRWQTPRVLGRNLVGEYKLELDAAADQSNALCHAFFSRKGRNALDAPWPADVRIWWNPPFKQASVWADMARDHARRGGFNVGLFLDRGAMWIEQLLLYAPHWRFTGRVQYERPADVDGSAGGVTFGSILVECGGDDWLRGRQRGWRNHENGMVVLDLEER